MKYFFQMLIILTVASIYGCHSNSVFTSGSVEAVNKNVSLKIGFSDYDRRQIYRYYNSGNRKKLPPGLTKKTSSLLVCKNRSENVENYRPGWGASDYHMTWNEIYPCYLMVI